ncbi:MAG: hypothetical protein IPH32_16500 [Bacteroidetes bacterium]|nr:hypothetical protein [Bacteroidota bacterium]
MQKAIIEIKKPCRVNLNSMTPDEKAGFVQFVKPQLLILHKNQLKK